MATVLRERPLAALGWLLAATVAVLALLILSTAGFAGEKLVARIPHADVSDNRGLEDAPEADEAAARGYRVLRTRPFIPPDFDQDVFENLWTTWPEPLRSRAEEATPEERRRMTFSRYGLVEAPGEPVGYGPGLGYVDEGDGGWVMNCLACHGGKVAGQVIPGLPNSHFALQTLTEEVAQTKLSLGKPLSHMELGALTIPLGTTNGTTNAVMFGVLVGSRRGPDMQVIPRRAMPELIHHDMDAPPLWNVKKKTHIYSDGHAPKTHRVLMQFMLLPSNDAETVLGWEDEFEDVLAWIESLEPPKYPFEIDYQLSARGERVFRRNCSRCHGTYGDDENYAQTIVPIDVIGTDPVRLEALQPVHRDWLRQSWMTECAQDPVVVDPGGYVAPPLDGIWATAPYFHNGSVPTLWHLLNPDERPAVWQRTENGYDRERIGLEVTTAETLPDSVELPAERRTWFDTRLKGKSAAGHRFPEALTPDERRAVLEYLKTL